MRRKNYLWENLDWGKVGPEGSTEYKGSGLRMRDKATAPEADYR